MWRSIWAAVLFGLCGCQSPAPSPPSSNRELLDIKPAAPRDDFRQALVTNDVGRLAQLLDAYPQVSPDEFLVGAAYAEIGAEMTRMLLTRGADVNLSRGRAIRVAAGNNNLTGARLLLEHGANPNVVSTNDDGSPLHVAAMHGNDQMIELLLKHRADPNIRDSKGRTPLMVAGNGGASTAWDLLIAHGADPNLRDDTGAMAPDYASGRVIAIAVQNNDITALKRTLAARRDVMNHRGSEGWRWGSADTVIALGRTEMLALMISNGLDVKLTDVNKITLLHVAARHGRADMARMLIKAGAQVDARDSGGRTPLRGMCEPGSMSDARYPGIPAPDFAATRAVLLDAGADVNVRDAEGGTPAFDPDPKAVRDLVKRGADVNAPDESNCTPLRMAAISGQWELAKTLIELGARRDIISACAMGEIDHVKQMLDADPALLNLAWENPEKNHLDYAPIVIACMHDRREVARLLIQRGANVNRGYWGWNLTPLQQAIEHDDVELAQMLIQRGAKTRSDDGSDKQLRDLVRSDAMRQLIDR